MNSFTLFKNWDFLGFKADLFAASFYFLPSVALLKKVIAGELWCLYGSSVVFSLAVMEVFVIFAGR